MNRRITWLILVFVFLSLAGSVLPLIPRVESFLPLPLLGRDQAYALHTLVLMAYMAFVFPMSLLAPPAELGSKERRRWDLAWWWVGGFILAFSGVPLFVLAYIAGVHLKAVLVVLAWAGVFHSLAILWARLFGYRKRSILIVFNFLLAVLIPALGFFGARLGLESELWSPFLELRALTLDFAEPGLTLPLALLGALSILVWLPFKKLKFGVSAAVLLSLLAIGAGQGGGGRAAVLTGDRFVPGRPVTVVLEARPGESLEVRVAERETWTWTPKAGDPERAFIHSLVLEAGERLSVRDGAGRLLVDHSMQTLPSEERLVLALGSTSAAIPAQARVLRQAAAEMDASVLGLLPFSAIVLGDGVEESLDREQKRALIDYLASGGIVLAPGEGSAARPQGRGLRFDHVSGGWPAGLELPNREQPASESNLYSSFALPDWGRVNLVGLTAFLGLYHFVFYLIFLLPLLIDARKGMGIYLTSVAFVLSLVVVGAYFVLKAAFLPENQILQQSLAVFSMTDMAGEQPMLLEQATCLASFNASEESLAFELAGDPLLVYPPGARGPGRLRVEPKEGRLEFQGLKLDRRLERQMIKLGARSDSPLALRSVPGGYRLEDRPQVLDRFSLRDARILGAFMRKAGRLHEVEVEGRELRPAAEEAALRWHSVVPPELRMEAIPFLSYALGRSWPAGGDLIGILLEGADVLHDGEGYLESRDVVQVLLIPLP